MTPANPTPTSIELAELALCQRMDATSHVVQLQLNELMEHNEKHWNEIAQIWSRFDARLTRLETEERARFSAAEGETIRAEVAQLEKTCGRLANTSRQLLENLKERSR